MHRASLRHRAFDPWPRAAQPWTTQDADAMRSGKTSAYLLKEVWLLLFVYLHGMWPFSWKPLREPKLLLYSNSTLSLILTCI